MSLIKHGAPLRADEHEMREFLKIIFKNCKDEKGWVALRAFNHEDDTGKAALSAWVPFGKGFIEAAVEMASKAASRSYENRAVFSPPVCLFGDLMVKTKDGGEYRSAGQANVICAPALAIDLDTHPVSSLIGLIAVLGEPTVVVASGGFWEGEPKMHAYWRLYEPAKTAEERAALRSAQSMAVKLVGGDKTGAPLSHPMRWPGSWHTKGEPKLCKMTTDGNHLKSITLDFALKELDKALMNANIKHDGVSSVGMGAKIGAFRTEVAWCQSDLNAAAEIIPNDDKVQWPDWSDVLMMLFDASHGSLDGLDAALRWSEKSPKFEPEATEQKWQHIAQYPPEFMSDHRLLKEIHKTDPSFAPQHTIVEAWFEQVAEKPPVEAESLPKDFKQSEAPADTTGPEKPEVEPTALDASAPVYIRELNKAHAFVMSNGKSFVANITGGGRVTLSARQSFFDRYANRLVQDGKRKASEADLWWTHKQRAQYLGGVDFDPNGVPPDVFNMWRGFPKVPGEDAVQASDGSDCALILRHIREVICSGVERDYEYLIKWLAHILQKPGEIAGVAVVLRGKKGTGKDTLGEYMGLILQHLYVPVSDPTLITGSFNSHLVGKLLLHVEEAIWAGDKKAEGILKSRITSSNMTAHQKGLDAYTVKSFLRVMMSSNEEWVAPATEDERRFFVLNVSDERMQSSAWFGPIRAEMRGKGPAAFAAYLRAVDLSGFDVRKPPATDALREQQQASLSDFALFWSEILEDEDAFKGCEGGAWEDQSAHVSLDEIERRYDRWREGRRFCKPVSRKKIGMLLTEYTGSDKLFRPRVDGIPGPKLRVLPSLGECRAAWSARFQRS